MTFCDISLSHTLSTKRLSERLTRTWRKIRFRMRKAWGLYWADFDWEGWKEKQRNMKEKIFSFKGAILIILLGFLLTYYKSTESEIGRYSKISIYGQTMILDTKTGDIYLAAVEGAILWHSFEEREEIEETKIDSTKK